MSLIKSLVAVVCFANFGDNTSALVASKPAPHDSLMAMHIVHQPRKRQPGVRPKITAHQPQVLEPPLLGELLKQLNQAPTHGAHQQFAYYYTGLKRKRITVQGNAYDSNGDYKINSAEIMRLKVFAKGKEALEYTKKQPDKDTDAINFFTTVVADTYKAKGNVFVLQPK